MIAENEQRLMEALLLLSFSPQELAPLSREEIRILAAVPYVPVPVSAEERERGSLHPKYRQVLEAMLASLSLPSTITLAQQKRRRRGIVSANHTRQRGYRSRDSNDNLELPQDPDPI